MNLDTGKSDVQSGSRRWLTAGAALMLGIGVITGGCAKKEAVVPASAPAGGAVSASADVAPGAAKPTPEQEAAKQRAIQQGPAIEAAMKRQQQGK